MNTCARYTYYDSYIKRHLNEYRYIFHQIWKKFMFNSIIREIIDNIKITTSATTSHQENSIINNGDSPIALNMGPHSNFGVLFDSTCDIKERVNKICRGVNRHLPLVKLGSVLKNRRLKKCLILLFHPVCIIATTFYMASMNILCISYNATRIIPLASYPCGMNMTTWRQNWNSFTNCQLSKV